MSVGNINEHSYIIFTVGCIEISTKEKKIIFVLLLLLLESPA